MDWYRGHKDTFRYVLVDKTTRHEKSRIETISACKLSRNANTSLKESGALTATGPVDFGHDLIRVYLLAEQDGVTETFPLGTMYPKIDETNYTGSADAASVTLMSSLLPLNAVTKTTVALDAGGVYVSKAAELITECGIPVIADLSTLKTPVALSWPKGTKKIDIINELLSYAGFWSVHPDVYGRAILSDYVAPNKRASVFTFADGASCTFLPSVKKTTNSADIPNVCSITFSQPNADPITETYTNDGTEAPFIGSPYSTTEVGYEIPLTDTLKSVPDGTLEEMSAYVLAKAKERLISATSLSESYSISAAYAPIKTNDVVSHKWEGKSILYDGSVQNMDLECKAGVPMTLEVKRVWR